MIVVDTNVVAYAVIPGTRTEAALAVVRREPDLLAPRLWRSELRNVLATAIRTAGMDLESAVLAFDAAEGLVQDIDIEGSARECLELAEQSGISAYDAEFVVVAEQTRTQLVTGDRRLARSFPHRAILLEDFAGHR